MRAGQDVEGSVFLDHGIEMNADHHDLFGEPERGFDVRDARLGRRFAEDGAGEAIFPDRDSAILVPGERPGFSGGFVEVKPAHQAEVFSQHAGEKVDQCGLAPQGSCRGVDLQDISGGNDNIAASDRGLMGLVSAQGAIEFIGDGGNGVGIEDAAECDMAIMLHGVQLLVQTRTHRGSPASSG